MGHEYEMKWWGWGQKDRNADLDHYPGIYAYLKKNFDISAKADPNSKLNFPQMDKGRITSEILTDLKENHPNLSFSVDDECRLIHSLGKAYRDLLLIRSGKIERATDIVFFPTSEKQVLELFPWALKHNFSLVPFGGGTSVVGGVDALKKEKQNGVATVNLSGMKKILKINTSSNHARVEAGIFGPELERELALVGYTLGHFPQSFEFSTVGGWAATRSSGQNSYGNGGIEDMILSLRLATPVGVMENLAVPREAAGPSLKEIIIGSEGAFGIITEVTLKVRPLPKKVFYTMYAFQKFADATLAGKMLIQQGVQLSILRISDEDETDGFIAMAKKLVPTFKDKMAAKFLKFKGIDLENLSTVLVGIEGDEQEIKARKISVRKIFAPFNAVELGEKAGKKWAKDRFFLPYLRDPFMDLGLVIDTLETATSWDEIHFLHYKLKTALKEVAAKQDVKCKIYCHLSHFYPSGASLYFTILANRDPLHPYKQWQEFKNKANEIIFKNNASISHHHGIGVDHKDHLFHSKLHKGLYQKMKTELDPDGLLNPGKLL